MNEQTLTGEMFDFDANHLSLSFINTLTGRLDEQHREHVKSYVGLIDWNQQAQLLTSDEVAQLLAYEQRQPEQARAIWERAIVCREALFRVFSSIAEGRTPTNTDLDMVNTELARAMSHARLIREGKSFVWGCEPKGEVPDSVLWPIIREAADLLISDRRELIRICAADDCSWIFLDISKNRSRRWCSMKSCGNRAKARQHYRQKKQPHTRRPQGAIQFK